MSCFCILIIIQNVKLDLDSNYLVLVVFLKEVLEYTRLKFKAKKFRQQKSMQNFPAGKEIICIHLDWLQS